MAPRKPKTVPPFDIDEYRKFLEGTTTTTIPSTTTPTTSTSTNTSTNRSRTLPLPPEVQQAELKLGYNAQRANALGIDTSDYYTAPTATPADFVSTGNAEIDAIILRNQANAEATKPKDDGGWWPSWGEIGKGALEVVGDAANVVGAPLRAVVSTIKEVSDIATGDASLGDWWDQFTDPTFGAGDVFGKTGNKWLDRAIGFTGDVLLDPLTYLTLGGSAIVKTGVNAAARGAAKQVGKTVAKEGVEALIKRGATQASVDALTKADDFYRIAQNGLRAAMEGGLNGVDEAAVRLARQSLDEAGQAVTSASIDIAKQVGGKNARVLIAEDVRKAAYDAWANSTDDIMRQTNQKLLDEATQDVVRSIGRKGVRRTYRGNAREELAEQARVIRQQAENTMLEIQRRPIQFTGDLPAFQAAQQAQTAKLLPLQTLIDSLSDDVIKDIAVRGYNAVKGDAARALGVSNASRFAISLPSKIGGRRAAFIGTEGGINKALGGAAVTARLALINKVPGGERALRAITPLGRNGLFTDDEVLQWRTALRSGKVQPGDAVRYTALLAANKDYVNIANAARRKAGNQTRKALGSLNDKESELVRKMLEVDVDPSKGWDEIEATFRAAGLQPTGGSLQAWQDIRLTLDGWYNEANSLASSVGANPLPRIKNYFPHAQSEDALKWIRDNPDIADRVAGGLGAGTNRQFLADNFIERSLKPDQKWFGYVLKQADIDGGAARLNEIARQYGGLDFDWFDMDIRRALSRYAENHSRFMATYNSIDRLANKLGVPVGYQNNIAGDVIREVPDRSYIVGKDELLLGLDSIRNDIDSLLNSPDIRALNPVELDDWATDVEWELDGILKKLQESTGEPILSGNTFVYPTVQVADVSEQIELFRALYLQPKTIQDAASGFGNLMQDQIDQIRFRLLDPADGDLTFLGAIDDVVERQLEDIQFVNRFPTVIEKGWKQLTTDIGPLRGFEVKEELASIFNNIKRVNDPQFAKALERTIGSFNRFFKSYATATPGFHVRNALSNAFQLVIAGVNIENVGPGLSIWGRYAQANRQAIKQGLGGVTPEEFIRTLGYPPSQERLLIQALDSIDLDATAFAEATGSASGRVGPTGKALKTGDRLEGPRAVLGTPIRVSRSAGQMVEGTNRFILTYDGLMRGLTPTEAIARTNKYLFDYSDLSRVDKSLRQIIPFWIWTSRNLPLQLENMLTNPRAYSQYFSLKKNLADNEQPKYLPDYLKQAGAFTVDGMLVQPDLGFPGAGKPSQLEELARIPLFLLSGQEDKAQRAVANVLGSTSPALRSIIEYGSGTNLFTGKPVVSEYSPESDTAQRAAYFGSQLLPPLSNIGGLANIAGFAPEGELARKLLGIPAKYTYNLTEEEIQRADDEQRERKLFRYFGLPFRTLGVGEQVGEVNRLNKQVLEEILRAENERNK